MEVLDHSPSKNAIPRFNGFYVLFVWAVTLIVGPFSAAGMIALIEGLSGAFDEVINYYYLVLLVAGFASFPALVVAYAVYFLLVYTEQSWRRVKLTVTLFAMVGLGLTHYVIFRSELLLPFFGYAVVLLLAAVSFPILRRSSV